MPNDTTQGAGAAGSTQTDTTTTGATAGDAMVPSSRLREETAKREAAEAKATAAEARIQALTQAEAGWTAERDIYRAGITDPDGVEIAQLLYGKLPEANRPTRGAWLSALTAATAPKGLAAYLPGASTAGASTSSSTAQAGTGATAGASTAQGAQGATATGTAAAGTAAKATGTTTTQATGATGATSAGAATGSSGYDAAQINAMRAEAVRTGDWTKLREAMPAIMQSVTRPK